MKKNFLCILAAMMMLSVNCVVFASENTDISYYESESQME